MAEVDTNIEAPELTPPPSLDAPEQETPGSGRSQIRRDLEEGFERTRRDDTQPRRRKGAPEPPPVEADEEPLPRCRMQFSSVSKMSTEAYSSSGRITLR